MSAPDLAEQAAQAGDYPSQSFNKREQKLLESVKEYVDNSPPNNVITTEGDLILGDSSGDADRLPIGASGEVLKSDGTTAEWGQVSTENLDSGISYSHRVFAAGEFTTLGGDASESISVPGALATDLAFVFLKTPGASPESVSSAAAGIDSIAVTMSGDPSTDHVLVYQLLRAAT